MTSKNLFFNLMKEDAKRRLWMLAMTAVTFFFVFPVRAALLVSDYTKLYTAALANKTIVFQETLVKAEVLEKFMGWSSMQNALTFFLLFIFAAVCGLSGYSYLHSKKKADFYHSIPVKREKLFFASYFNGILLLAIPYLINLILATLLLQVKMGAGISWGTIFYNFLLQMLFFILLYSTMVLAVIMTGNVIVSLLGMMVFHLWAPAVGALLYGYHSTYFTTFFLESFPLRDGLNKISPLFWYIFNMDKDFLTIGSIWISVGVVIVITLLAVFLYRLRPSEAAGKAMAFKKSQAIIKFLLVIPMALSGSLFFRQMKDSTGWGVFGLICGLLLSYAIIEIIYNFDFRKMFAHKWQLISCGAVSAFVLVFFALDLPGYDSYLPGADKLSSGAIYCRYLDGDLQNDYYSTPVLEKSPSAESHDLYFQTASTTEIMEKMELKNVEEVLSMAEKGIKSTEESNNDYLHGSTGKGYRNLIIGYHLKTGKTVYRSYNYNMDMMEIDAELGAIYSQKEYKETAYPVLKETVDNITGVNFQEYGEYRHVKLSGESMTEELLTVYQKELLALSAETRKQESPIAHLQFKTKEVQEMIELLRTEKDGIHTSFNDYYYYPVYPSFTETISLLKECNISVGTFLNSENVEKIEVVRTRNDRDGYMEKPMAIEEEDVLTAEASRSSLVVKDKAEITELLDASVQQYYGENALNPVCGFVEMTVYVPRGTADNEKFESSDFSYKNTRGDSTVEYNTYRLYLDQDKIPDFLRESLPGSFD